MHKPRKKQGVSNSPIESNVHAVQTPLKIERLNFPLSAFLWPTKGTLPQWIVVLLILMILGLFRWTVGLWAYSGQKSPPMYGDFEAQRHWMEITTHLPISQWYFYDLEWWGLDYPPLTAYHSWLLGKVGSFFNPAWFALDTSRGFDGDALKLYMRATVLVSEYSIYVPAVVTFVQNYPIKQNGHAWKTSIALLAILMQPATILIDHAHFQYNTVMLGFVVAAMACINTEKPLWACVFFVSGLGFKQMSLYYAPAVFAYLLGSCFSPKLAPERFFQISLVTAISFALLFLPLIIGPVYEAHNGTDAESLPAPPLLRSLGIAKKALYYPALLQITQSIHRVFPFARGLFEDKVANFWCAAHTFHKLHRYPTMVLQQSSVGATAAAVIPPFLALLLYPRRSILPVAMAASAWGFFLFSFQVHEKSVLLPLLPMTLLLSGGDGLLPENRAWVTWANVLGAWTLFPLLKRDQLRVPYFVLTMLWAWLMGVRELLFPSQRDTAHGSINLFTRLLHGCFYIGMILWHVVEALVPPPDGKPDIWVVINVIIGAAGFGICYLWCLWRLLELLINQTSGAKSTRLSAKKLESKKL